MTPVRIQTHRRSGSTGRSRGGGWGQKRMLEHSLNDNLAIHSSALIRYSRDEAPGVLAVTTGLAIGPKGPAAN
jgi:hypothetical protein